MTYLLRTGMRCTNRPTYTKMYTRSNKLWKHDEHVNMFMRAWTSGSPAEERKLWWWHLLRARFECVKCQYYIISSNCNIIYLEILVITFSDQGYCRFKFWFIFTYTFHYFLATIISYVVKKPCKTALVAHSLGLWHAPIRLMLLSVPQRYSHAHILIYMIRTQLNFTNKKHAENAHISEKQACIQHGKHVKETACNPRGFWRAEQSESIHNYSNSFIRGEYLPLFLNIWIFISAVVAVKIISCSFPLYPFSKLRYTWHRYPPNNLTYSNI